MKFLNTLFYSIFLAFYFFTYVLFLCIFNSYFLLLKKKKIKIACFSFGFSNNVDAKIVFQRISFYFI